MYSVSLHGTWRSFLYTIRLCGAYYSIRAASFTLPLMSYVPIPTRTSARSIVPFFSLMSGLSSGDCYALPLSYGLFISGGVPIGKCPPFAFWSSFFTWSSFQVLLNFLCLTIYYLCLHMMSSLFSVYFGFNISELRIFMVLLYYFLSICPWRITLIQLSRQPLYAAGSSCIPRRGT